MLNISNADYLPCINNKKNQPFILHLGKLIFALRISESAPLVVRTS